MLITLILTQIVCSLGQGYSIDATTRFAGHEYILLRGSFTRSTAITAARFFNAYLAVPDSHEENVFLSGFAKGNSVWLGIRRKSSNLPIFVREHDGQPVRWTNWNSSAGYSEPNFLGGNEWFVMMYGKITPWWSSSRDDLIGKWNDHDGFQRLSVILELPPKTRYGYNPDLGTFAVMIDSWRGRNYDIFTSDDCVRWFGVARLIGDGSTIFFVTLSFNRKFFKVIEID